MTAPLLHSIAEPTASSATLSTALQGVRPSTVRRAPDVESCRWIRALSGTGPEREAAVERLHALLVRAARFELARRWRTGAGGRSGELDDLAVQAADDALMALIGKLHTYRGDSRFTTWAYKFALLEAAVGARRRAWRGRELSLEADGLAQLLSDRRASPADQAEASELVRAACVAIAEVLTAQQRAVLVAITLDDVPIDVLAERRGTTRGALYKTLHDARRKLRAELAKNGLALDPLGKGQKTCPPSISSESSLALETASHAHPPA